MRYGEDYWTPEEVENGAAPSTAVYDAQAGVYRKVSEDDAQADDDDEPRGQRERDARIAAAVERERHFLAVAAHGGFCYTSDPEW
jgi:hypothetical protein